MRRGPHRKPGVFVETRVPPTNSGALVVCHPPSGMHYLVDPQRLEGFRRENPGALWPCRHLPRRPPREARP